MSKERKSILILSFLLSFFTALHGMIVRPTYEEKTTEIISRYINVNIALRYRRDWIRPSAFAYVSRFPIFPFENEVLL